jgi:hypothetical protein
MPSKLEAQFAGLPQHGCFNPIPFFDMKEHPLDLAISGLSGHLASIAHWLKDTPTCESNERIASSLEEIAECLESTNERLGVIANALLQISDKHGSTTPGPF